MTPDRWQRLDALCHAAGARPGSERAAFLLEACPDDEELRREVASLLAHAESAVSFLETPPMSAPELIGRLLGAYRIDALIGSGGMGDVYRATDTRLSRTVAVKILPPVWAADAGRRARFEREARVVAALKHPNICTIYDIGRDQGVEFLVIEFIDGESLSDRLARGPLPLDQVLAYAIEIADALSKAHRQGIVHRDLKPGNVMLTKTGTKLLDFGLARIVSDEIGVSASVGAAITAPLTEAGAVLGTIQYMAPEQIEGEVADQRSDVFAFGALLYEMVTAKRAFTGATTASLMAAILRADAPSLAAVPWPAPRALDRLVRTCLAKDPGARFSTMHDVAVGLRGIVADVEESARQTTTVSVTRVARPPVRVLVTVLLVAIAVAGYWLGSRDGSRPNTVAQTFSEIVPPPGSFEWRGLALSPDGRRLVVNVSLDRHRHLWLRELGSLAGRLLEGTDGGENPFWSPDGRSVGFFANGTLQRIDLSGGAPVPICPAGSADGGAVGNARGGAWFDDGTIVFAPDRFSGLQRVRAEGSEPESFLTLDAARGEVALRFPTAIGGRSLVYLAVNADPNLSEIRRASLDAPGQSATVVRTRRSAAFADGWLFYDRQGPVVAQRLDERTGAVTGEPWPVSEAPLNGTVGQMNFTARGATLAWWTERPAPAVLEWADRHGSQIGSLGPPEVIRTLTLSPDESSVAVVKETNGQPDIWVIDTRTGKTIQLTSDHAWKSRLVWSATGRLAFSSYGGRAGAQNIYTLDPSGTALPVPIAEDLANLIPLGWFARDQAFAWLRQPTDGDRVLRTRSLEPRTEPVDLAQKAFGDLAALSPDAAVIAYTLREAGQLNLFVDRFPALNAPQLVARNVTGYPRWRQDGHEVFFGSKDWLMAATIQPGVNLRVETPTRVLPLASSVWDVNRDGTRFLLAVPKAAPIRTISLIQNWSPPGSR